MLVKWVPWSARVYSISFGHNFIVGVRASASTMMTKCCICTGKAFQRLRVMTKAPFSFALLNGSRQCNQVGRDLVVIYLYIYIYIYKYIYTCMIARLLDMYDTAEEDIFGFLGTYNKVLRFFVALITCNFLNDPCMKLELGHPWLVYHINIIFTSKLKVMRGTLQRNRNRLYGSCDLLCVIKNVLTGVHYIRVLQLSAAVHWVR